MNSINVQFLNNMNEDHFEILRTIQNKPKASQRELADELGFSLGKLNYCLRALKLKGLVKIENFRKKSKKIKLYLCFDAKRNYRKNKNNNKLHEEKMKEYEELKKEINK